jgi:hypothetical protein
MVEPQPQDPRPCCRHRNFPLVAYEKLMAGLPRTKGLKTDEERRRHILENMLYMVELNGNNVRLMKKIFGGDQYKLNIVKGDFLEDKTHKKLLNMLGTKELKFDLVMGNPPYNKNKEVDINGKGRQGVPIWHLFIEQSLKMLRSSSYLVFINPPGWRRPESKQSTFKGMYNQMTKENQMIYIKMFSIHDGEKYFDSNTKMDICLLKKENGSKPTIIEDEANKLHRINIFEYPWLPNQCIHDVFELFAKGNEEHVKVIWDTSYGTYKQNKWVSSEPSFTHKYKLVHSTTTNIPVLWYSSTNDNGHYGIKKVIFGLTGTKGAFYDDNGSFATTQQAMSIPVCSKKDGLELSRYLQSESFQRIFNACIWSGYAIEWKTFLMFRNGFWKNQPKI